MAARGGLTSSRARSAAHGQLENVQKLLSTGSIVATISLSLSIEEFTDKIQGIVKQVMSPLLASNILERDITIASVVSGDSSSKQTAKAEHAEEVLLVNLIVRSPDVHDAQEVAARMAAPSFTSDLVSTLSSRVRTVQWDVKIVEKPQVIRHTVDDRDKIGCSALHWAALNDRHELMLWLINHGADKDAKANDGHTALHWAALKGHLRACKVLLDAKCAVDERDEWHFTPLIRAAQNGHVLVVLLLLRGGADAGAVDEELHNSLHWAVFHRHHAVVRWLLEPAWAPGLQVCMCVLCVCVCVCVCVCAAPAPAHPNTHTHICI